MSTKRCDPTSLDQSADSDDPSDDDDDGHAAAQVIIRRPLLIAVSSQVPQLTYPQAILCMSTFHKNTAMGIILVSASILGWLDND